MFYEKRANWENVHYIIGSSDLMFSPALIFLYIICIISKHHVFYEVTAIIISKFHTYTQSSTKTIALSDENPPRYIQKHLSESLTEMRINFPLFY